MNIFDVIGLQTPEEKEKNDHYYKDEEIDGS
jgi:hypothetical protein